MHWKTYDSLLREAEAAENAYREELEKRLAPYGRWLSRRLAQRPLGDEQAAS